jgi:hypothetical protein
MLLMVDLKRVAMSVQLSLSLFLGMPAAHSSEVGRVPIDNAEMLTKCA